MSSTGDGMNLPPDPGSGEDADDPSDAQVQEKARLDLERITAVEFAAATDHTAIESLRAAGVGYRITIADLRDAQRADDATIARLLEAAGKDEATISELLEAAGTDDATIRDLRRAAVHEAAVALEKVQQDVINLEAALINARRIGGAIGVLMGTMRVTESEAFELLVGASRNTNRKVRDVAEDVMLTGALLVSRKGTRA